MIKVKDDSEAIDLIESHRHEMHLSIADVADTLGITRNHYNRLCRDGRLHGHKVDFLQKVSAFLGDTIEIDGVNNDSTAD